MAEGAGWLELVFFDLDVIEHYRNDPRYHFTFSDFEVSFGVGDDAFLDEAEPERDKISSMRCGFAYDRDALKSDGVRRYLCSFYKDLADLTPEHQRRWESYEVRDAATIAPHPVWWTMMMGHWPDGFGPFDKILFEIDAINDVFTRIYGQSLFRTTARPREWGWLLRSSSSAWYEFVLTTDKLLSENIRHDALDAARVVRRSVDDVPLGSLVRLERFLADVAHVNADDARSALKPLREIRSERQKPAHSVTAPKSDASAVARQRDILGDIGDFLESLRRLLASHPDASGWEPPDHLDGVWYRL
jgi:hypothetical protein